MHINFSITARKLITEQDGCITAKLEQRTTDMGCCGPRVTTYPFARLGVPTDQEMEQYKKIEIDGVIVYVHANLEKINSFKHIDIDVAEGELSSRMVMRAK